jgi:hypothetical protein
VVEDVKAWINGTLIGPDGYCTPTGFEYSLPLYSTPRCGSFVRSVIDGSTRPAPFRVPSGSGYCELIRSVRRVSADEPACWFYGTDPDNARSLPSWVRRCHYDHALDYALESFETEPTREGGCAWLGLAGASRRWHLLHEYSACNSFGITLHGPAEFSRAVAAGVGIVAAPGTSLE